LPFIFATINTRIKTFANRTIRDIKNTNDPQQITEKKFFTIPYIKSIPESFLPIIKKIWT